ncbi:MAG: phage holin family protein [Patescibacteria group bacterium]|nr:phage holin family protein [Patescibacteria group bacterium]
MVEVLIRWLISAIAIIITSYLLTGVHVDSFITALLTALVLGIINAIFKPLFIILTLPINILSLGLFTFVINAILIILTSLIVPGFKVDNFWWALLFSLVLSVINWLLHRILRV